MTGNRVACRHHAHINVRTIPVVLRDNIAISEFGKVYTGVTDQVPQHLIGKTVTLVLCPVCDGRPEKDAA